MAKLDFSESYFTIRAKTYRENYRYLNGVLMEQTKEEKVTERSHALYLRDIWKKHKYKTEENAKKALARLEQNFPYCQGWFEVVEQMDWVIG